MNSHHFLHTHTSDTQSIFHTGESYINIHLVIQGFTTTTYSLIELSSFSSYTYLWCPMYFLYWGVIYKHSFSHTGIHNNNKFTDWILIIFFIHIPLIPNLFSILRKEIFYLMTHSTHFYLRLYGVRHMVKDHSDIKRGNLLQPLHGLLFSINSTAFVTPGREGRKCFIKWHTQHIIFMVTWHQTYGKGPHSTYFSLRSQMMSSLRRMSIRWLSSSSLKHFCNKQKRQISWHCMCVCVCVEGRKCI